MIRDLRLRAKTYFSEQFYKHLTLYVPYLWLVLFLAIPFLIILKISFSQVAVSLPPISNIINNVGGGIVQLNISFKNYITIFTDSFYLNALEYSMLLALLSTFITLLMGYMLAYGIYKAPKKHTFILLMFVMLPFWTSFLVRVYSWMNILSASGLINQMLMSFKFIASPLQLLDNPYAVCLGIVYCYLPFMVLPIYTALEKIDESYSEAAYDLGAKPSRVFWRIILPLSKTGVYTGCILVFMPAIGEFVIPELLGGPDTITIGRALWWEFFNNRDWPLASALAILILITLVVPIMFFQKHLEQEKDRD